MESHSNGPERSLRPSSPRAECACGTNSQAQELVIAVRPVHKSSQQKGSDTKLHFSPHQILFPFKQGIPLSRSAFDASHTARKRMPNVARFTAWVFWSTN